MSSIFQFCQRQKRNFLMKFPHLSHFQFYYPWIDGSFMKDIVDRMKRKKNRLNWKIKLNELIAMRQAGKWQFRDICEQKNKQMHYGYKSLCCFIIWNSFYIFVLISVEHSHFWILKMLWHQRHFGNHDICDVALLPLLFVVFVCLILIILEILSNGYSVKNAITLIVWIQLKYVSNLVTLIFRNLVKKNIKIKSTAIKYNKRKFQSF